MTGDPAAVSSVVRWGPSSVAAAMCRSRLRSNCLMFTALRVAAQHSTAPPSLPPWSINVTFYGKGRKPPSLPAPLPSPFPVSALLAAPLRSLWGTSALHVYLLMRP